MIVWTASERVDCPHRGLALSHAVVARWLAGCRAEAFEPEDEDEFKHL